MFAEQLGSECEKALTGEHVSCLTLLQYESMGYKEKNHLNNRIRQWALKARENLWNDHGVFCLVLGHLLHNAHRYFKMDRPSELQEKLLEDRTISECTRQQVITEFKVANK